MKAHVMKRSGVLAMTLAGALLAGCGGELGSGGEEDVDAPAPATEVSQAADGLVESKVDSGQPQGRIGPMALGCSATTVQWSQPRSAWNLNTYTSGTYYCTGNLPAASSGFNVPATLTSWDRTGSANYTCSNGTWIRTSGSCDGKIVETSSVSGISTTCSSADPVQSKWIGWFLADLKRCADVDGLVWWVNGYNNNTDCLASTNYNGYGNKDACWRAQFRAGANMNGNSYNEAQAAGHVSSWDEANLCGPGAAYPWSSVSAFGTKCKYRP